MIIKCHAGWRRWITIGWCAVLMLSAWSRESAAVMVPMQADGKQMQAQGEEIRVGADDGLEAKSTLGRDPAGILTEGDNRDGTASKKMESKSESKSKREAPAVPSLTRKQERKRTAYNWRDMQRKYRGVFILRANEKQRRVALTFDDVPDSIYTPLVLDVLKRKKVSATFFVVGSRAEKHPNLVRRIVREGHAVGNHSYSHPNLTKLGLESLRQEVERTGTIIRRVTGFTPRMIRPPYGEIGPAQLEWAKRNGYAVVNWDVDSSDWRQLPSSTVFRNVVTNVRPGSIVLMHAGGGGGQNLYGTVKALPQLIDWLRSKGYQLVTVPELLGVEERKFTGAFLGSEGLQVK